MVSKIIYESDELLRIRILTFLYNNPDTFFVRIRISNEVNVNPKFVGSELKLMVKKGLIRTHPITKLVKGYKIIQQGKKYLYLNSIKPKK